MKKKSNICLLTFSLGSDKNGHIATKNKNTICTGLGQIHWALLYCYYSFKFSNSQICSKTAVGNTVEQ